MQTVVGVFDTIDDAENARESLLDAGFNASEVRVQSSASMQDGEYRSSTGNATTATDAIHTDRNDRSDEGFMAGIGRFFSDLFGSDNDEHAGNYSEAVRRGGSVVVVSLADESRSEAARAALAAAGAVDIDKRSESWRQEGYSRFDPAAQPYQADEIVAERSRYQAGSQQVANGTVLPVVREDLEVGKRAVDLGTVRVFSRTETRPVEEQVQLREERAEIERRTVDRPATEADLKAFEGGSIEIHETAERPVVSKTARVVEEVLVGTEASTRTETVSDQVRSTVVEVDKSGVNGASGAAAMPDYRRHYQANIASLGGSYEDYAPAYQYGSTLRSDPRHANRSWDEVETEAQRDWTSRYPDSGSTWERTKQAVRHGWESMTGQR